MGDFRARCRPRISRRRISRTPCGDQGQVSLPAERVGEHLSARRRRTGTTHNQRHRRRAGADAGRLLLWVLIYAEPIAACGLCRLTMYSISNSWISETAAQDCTPAPASPNVDPAPGPRSPRRPGAPMRPASSFPTLARRATPLRRYRRGPAGRSSTTGWRLRNAASSPGVASGGEACTDSWLATAR